MPVYDENSPLPLYKGHCPDHGTTNLLVNQHQDRLHNIEETAELMGRDVAKMEGRINSFLYMLGIVFAALLGMATYGAIQIDQFKDIWSEETISQNESLSTIKADVGHLKKDVEGFKK